MLRYWVLKRVLFVRLALSPAVRALMFRVPVRRRADPVAPWSHCRAIQAWWTVQGCHIVVVHGSWRVWLSLQCWPKRAMRLRLILGMFRLLHCH